jgi:glutathione synthase
MEYIYGTYLLELAEQQGASVFNKPSAIRDHNEKLAIAQFSEFTSPTLVTADEARIRAFHADKATSSSSRSTAWAAPASSASRPTA